MDILGVHLDSPFTRTAQMRKIGAGLEVISLKTQSDSKENLHPGKAFVVTAIDSKKSLIKKVELKGKLGSNLEAALKFQIESNSFFESSKFLNVSLIEKKKDKALVDLFIVSKQDMQDHINQIQKLHLESDLVTIVPRALYLFFQWKYPDIKDAILIDIGSSETGLVFVENGKVKKFHGISCGVEHLLQALLEDRKRILLKKEIEGAARQIDLLLLKPNLNPNLSEKLNYLHDEIARCLYFFQKENIQIPIFLTGRVDAFIHFGQFLLGQSYKILPVDAEEQKFAISIGLCLESIQKKSLQLLQEEFFPVKNWKKLGRYALFLIFLSLGFSAGILGFTQMLQTQKKEALILQLPETFCNDEEICLEKWISSVEGKKEEDSYLFKSVKVSEFLDWFSKVKLDFEVEAMRYTLVSFPKIESPKASFQAKVELEFKTQNGAAARKFHEMLNQDKQIIDTSREIKRESLKDGYRTSFFLRAKG